MLHVLNILERIPASKCSLWKNQVSALLVACLCLGQDSGHDSGVLTFTFRHRKSEREKQNHMFSKLQ